MFGAKFGLNWLTGSGEEYSLSDDLLLSVGVRRRASCVVSQVRFGSEVYDTLYGIIQFKSKSPFGVVR